MIEYMVLLAQIIGFLILAWVAVCVTCLMAFTVLLTWTYMLDHLKSRSGKHQTAGKLTYIPGLEDIEKQEQFRAAEMATLKQKLTGGDQTEVFQAYEETAFNMKGENVTSIGRYPL